MESIVSKEEYKKRIIKQRYIQKYKAKKIAKDIYLKKGMSDVVQKIVNNLTRRITKTLDNVNIKRTQTIRQLIGCTNNELKNHLKTQFREGMSFENYGDWEVDHIKPVASFALHHITEQLTCFNYKNLQPLWKAENRTKSCKTDWTPITAT